MEYEKVSLRKKVEGRKVRNSMGAAGNKREEHEKVSLLVREGENAGRVGEESWRRGGREGRKGGEGKLGRGGRGGRKSRKRMVRGKGCIYIGR